MTNDNEQVLKLPYEMVRFDTYDDYTIRIKRAKGYQHICEDVEEAHAKKIVDSVNNAQRYKELQKENKALKKHIEFLQETMSIALSKKWDDLE